jgi:hypothetical protein
MVDRRHGDRAKDAIRDVGRPGDLKKVTAALPASAWSSSVHFCMQSECFADSR